MRNRPLARGTVVLALGLVGIACRPPPTPASPAAHQPENSTDELTDEIESPATDESTVLDGLQPGSGGDIVDPITRVTISPLIVIGALHPEIARRRIRSHAAAEQIRRCWESRDATDISTGSLTLTLRVSAAGEVDDATVTPAEPRLESVARCVETFIREQSFPADTPGAVEATLTLAPNP